MEVHAPYQMFVHVLWDGLAITVELVRQWNVDVLTNWYDFVKDINECNGNHACDHNCTNVDGSYICSCDPGYELQSDSRSCEGFTEWLVDSYMQSRVLLL